MMHRHKRLLRLALGLVLAVPVLIGLASCGVASKILTAYFYNALTGARVDLLTDSVVKFTHQGVTYTITADKKTTKGGFIDATADTLQIENWIDGEDYVVEVSVTGYYTMVSRNTFVRSSNIRNNTFTPAYPVFVASLIPTTFTASGAAYVLNVVDQDTGAAVTSGTYVLKPTTGGNVVGLFDTNISGLFPVGFGSNEQEWMYSDVPNLLSGLFTPITGTISATGTVDIAAGTLFPGVTYQVSVIGATGYAIEASGAFTVVANVSDTTDPAVVTVAVDPLDNPTQTLAWVDMAHMDFLTSGPWDDATAQPVANGRVLSFEFNYEVDLRLNPAQNLSGGTILSIAAITRTTANTDGDAITTGNVGTGTGLTAAAAGSQPAGISVAASGRIVTVTLTATDAELIGTIDADDALAYTIDETAFLDGISVRIKGTNAAFQQLISVPSARTGVGVVNSIGGYDEIVIR